MSTTNSNGTVRALWVGPYGYRLVDGTVLETNVTVADIPAGEAQASDYWKPEPEAPAKTKTAKEGDA